MARGDIETNRIVRVAQKQAKRKAAPKKKVKNAPARSGGGIAGVSVAVARRQTTPKQVVRRTRKAGRPAPKQRAQQGSRSLDEAFAKLGLGGDNTKTRGRDVQTGGLPDRLQLLRNNSPDSFFGGLLKNTARGALDIVTGLPAAAQLAGENAAAFNPVVGPLRLVPGLDAVDRFQNRVAGMDKRAATAVKDQYAWQYGPLARGDFAEFGRRAYQNPLGPALDLAGSAAVVGRVGNIGAKLTRAAAPGSKAAARASRRLSIAPAEERRVWAQGENRERSKARAYAPGKRIPRKLRDMPFEPGPGGRYRPPVVLRSQANTKGGRVAEAKVAIDRRPYSPNVIVRSVQRRRDRGSVRRQEHIDRVADRKPSTVPVVGPIRNVRTKMAQRRTTEARFQRAEATAARETRYMSERRAEAMVHNTPEYRTFVKATRSLKKDKNTAGVPEKRLGMEELATSLHLDDYVSPRAGKTPEQLRDEVVTKWERELNRYEEDYGPQPVARAQIEKIKQIKIELLRLEGNSPAVQRVRLAVQAGRDLDRVNQQRQVAAGVIDEDTAQAMRSRPSSIVHGGSEWLPNVLRRMKDEGASRGARSARRDREIAGDPRVAKARKEFADADANLRKLSFAKATPAKIKAATRKRDKAKARLKRVEDAATKRLTRPDKPEMVGRNAVYRPAMPSDNRPAGSPFAKGRGFSGPQRAKQEKGTRRSTGTYDMNPALLAHQARRAAGNVTGPMSPRALNELIDTAAYKIDGDLATGKRAYQLMANDSEKVVLVNRKSLQQTMRKLDRLENGKHLDAEDARIFYGEPGKGQTWLQPVQKKAVTGDYVAISKGAAEAWRESMTAPWKWLDKYDNALDLWKGGLLALSPRWYVTNIVGLAFQYGILSGGDFRAMYRAMRSPEIKRAIAEKNPDVAISTLADELTSNIDPKRFEDASAVMAVIRGGYKLNNNIEAAWRRGAYLNRAKKMLRDEGGKFRGMSDKEIAAAIDRMPQSVARQVVRDVDFYIGEYGRFRPFERQFLKRVVPFYSWLRVIGRLTLGLPFRSPLRVAAMAVLSNAATAGLNPNDYMLPVYARGSLNVGKYKVPTYSLNPFQSLAPVLEGVGESNPLGGVLKAGVGWATPAVQFPVNQAFGLNNFGEGVFAPPGSGDTAQQYGRPPREWNTSSGRPEDATIRIPMSEALLQTLLPGFVNPLRRALIGEETAFDTTTTPDLLGLTGKPRSEKFYQRKGPRARKPAAVNPFTSFLGAPLYEQDDALIAKQYRKALKDYQDAVRQTKRRKKKAGR